MKTAFISTLLIIAVAVADAATCNKSVLAKVANSTDAVTCARVSAFEVPVKSARHSTLVNYSALCSSEACGNVLKSLETIEECTIGGVALRNNIVNPIVRDCSTKALKDSGDLLSDSDDLLGDVDESEASGEAEGSHDAPFPGSDVDDPTPTPSATISPGTPTSSPTPSIAVTTSPQASTSNMGSHSTTTSPATVIPIGIRGDEPASSTPTPTTTTVPINTSAPSMTSRTSSGSASSIGSSPTNPPTTRPNIQNIVTSAPSSRSSSGSRSASSGGGSLIVGPTTRPNIVTSAPSTVSRSSSGSGSASSVGLLTVGPTPTTSNAPNTTSATPTANIETQKTSSAAALSTAVYFQLLAIIVAAFTL